MRRFAPLPAKRSAACASVLPVRSHVRLHTHTCTVRASLLYAGTARRKTARARARLESESHASTLQTMSTRGNRLSSLRCQLIECVRVSLTTFPRTTALPTYTETLCVVCVFRADFHSGRAPLVKHCGRVPSAPVLGWSSQPKHIRNVSVGRSLSLCFC